MEAAIVYLAKASAIMAMFIVAYHVFLKKETFFNSNRGFLLAGLFTAVLLPLLTYTKVIWVQAAPVIAIHKEINISRLIAANRVMQLTKHSIQAEPFTINWWYVTVSIYVIGVVFFLLRFVADVVRVRRMLTGQQIVKQDNYKLIDTTKAVAPFSFFGYIVYNSSLLQPQELESIIAHEKVHSRQWHSADMIIGQLFCAAFWFNPFVWMYKKSISQNLEFIADAEATRQLEDKVAYQKTLLKITLQPECIAITNHFYQSLIKKRIVMLNKTQSKKRNGLKYAIVLPALAAFMFLFQYKVIAQEKEPATVTTDNIKFVVEITKDAKDKELQEQSKYLKKEYGADVAFSKITRNSKGEITGLKIAIKESGKSSVQEITSTTPITPFTIEVEKDSNGTRTAMVNGNGAVRIMPGYPAPPTPPAAPGFTSPAAPPAPPVPPTHTNGTGYIINTQDDETDSPILNFGNSDALVIINGIVQPKGQQIVLPVGQQIAAVTTLDKKEAKKKYGKDAKKGAVEITTTKGSSKGYALNTDQILSYAQQGLDTGLAALADINFQKLISDGLASVSFDEIKGLSDEEMEEMQEELRNAQLEIQKVGPELQRQFKENLLSKEDMEDAKREIEEAKKEIEQAKKEIIKAKKEIEQTKKQTSRKA